MRTVVTLRDASVGAIAAELQSSRRRLGEAFREYVGLTPKAVARIVRFDLAVRRVLTREFREFSGLTPTAFIAQSSAAGLLTE